MSTIINSPTPQEPTIVQTDSGAASSGWVVAVIILLAVVAGGAYFWMHRSAPAAPAGDSTNINVTLPPTTSDQQPATTP